MALLTAMAGKNNNVNEVSNNIAHKDKSDISNRP